jgi:hypothetical protein
MLNNQQKVVQAKEEISKLKRKYDESIKNYLSQINSDNLTNIQKAGNELFNYCEELVGNSSLLGAHENAYWAQGFAEDCFAILKIIPPHYELLKTGFKKSGYSSSIKPVSTAFANMQRLSKKYVNSSEIKELYNSFLNQELPVYGFKNEENKFMSKKLQTILSFVFGVTFILLLLGTAYLTPNPSSYQYMVFRVVLALAGGGVVATFPGFIELKLGNWLRAGGALAVFAIIYFFSPAVLNA